MNFKYKKHTEKDYQKFFRYSLKKENKEGTGLGLRTFFPQIAFAGQLVFQLNQIFPQSKAGKSKYFALKMLPVISNIL